MDPHAPLVAKLQKSVFTQFTLTSDEVYGFLAGLIECKTIAQWLLVCPLNGYDYSDLSADT